MEKGKTYTENELGELEEDIRDIFYKEHITSFLVHKANRLIKKWKKLTNWKEND